MQTDFTHTCTVCYKVFQSQKKIQKTCSLFCRGKSGGSAPSKLICSCGRPAGKKGRCRGCSLEAKRKSRRNFYYRHRERVLETMKAKLAADPARARRDRQRRLEGRFNGLRRARLEKDNHTCQDCGAIELLVVHHIHKRDRNRRDYESTIDDLLTLCRKCHIKLHHELGDLKRA